MNHNRKLLSLLLIPLLLCVTLSCKQQATYMQVKGEVFHTYYQIKYKGTDDLSPEIDAAFERLSHALNAFDSTSIIAAINTNRTMEVDSVFLRVFNRAQEISALSAGSYDISAAPLINAWGFGFEKAATISPELIDSLRQFVGYQKIRYDGERIVKDDPRLMLNASSIAKGYAADLVAEALEAKGVTDYLVEVGGEIVYNGLNPSGKAWHVGINKPIDDPTGGNQELELIVSLEGKGALASSGNYRNFYVKDGKKYAHTIDPLTGYPVQTDVLSATVIAPDCMTADALGTTFMVVGSQRVAEIAKQLPGVEYFLILASDSSSTTTLMSSGFAKFLIEK